jgi:hypothetical protein
MAFSEELANIALQHSASRNVGAYYGSATHLAPGAGVIFSGVAYASYDPAQKKFEARRGPILILTHECDIDPANVREFNTGFVLAPLILMAAFAAIFQQRRDLGRNLARDIAGGRVSRMFYLPPTPQFAGWADFRLGGFIYLNAITSGHIDQLKERPATAVCALSEYALDFLDKTLTQHFLRPKAEQLARLR